MKRLKHRISLTMAPDAAFPLFTPKGEERWVPDWRPQYLHPPSGEAAVDMVFCTGAGDDLTIWTCLAFDEQRRHARYLRTTPASRVAFVDVRCLPEGAGTRVEVEYGFVPLTDAGAAYVDALSEERFAAMVEQWKELIEAA